VTLAQRCRIVRVWTIQGELVSELRGHTDYVYEVCAGQNEAILSCGEDHSVVSG
jgi:WD40 repeat protein